MRIGDKIIYETEDYKYEATVVAEKKDGTKVIISIPALGRTEEIDNE